MPYLNGVRVTQEQWAARQPVKPVYIYDANGGQHLQNGPELVEGEDRQSAEAWAKEENGRRAAGLLFGYDVSPVTPDMWPGREDVTYEQVKAARDEKHQRKVAGIIATVTEATRSPGNEEATDPERGQQAADSTSSQAAHQTTSGRAAHRETGERRPQSAVSFAEERGMPMHDPNRPSQQPAGRHARYVRAQAREWGVSNSVADGRIKSHPADCEWRAVS